MLFSYIQRLLTLRKDAVRDDEEEASSLNKANDFVLRGDKHAAVAAFRKHLESDPYNVQALNDLGACLADVGETAECMATFELAYSLDDTFLPVVVNHGKMLNDQRRSTEALPFLRQAKVSDPNYSHADAVYADLCLKMGDLVKARHFQLRAWLANFDNLRLANCHLFTCAYDDLDELRLAAEHRFWAETVRPALILDDLAIGLGSDAKIEHSPTQKIRIGYWSSDFRSHSVRYFFRPLLENHDLSQFEIYLYHDFPAADAQTALIRAASSHFYDVCETSDVDLYKLIKSHQLDILVELAGHSSHNRIPLLLQRFATVQLTALGYPPTTGLSTLDAKLLDRHVVTPDSPRYYAESPLVLPTSFWCFDPMEDAPVAQAPPSILNGYVTFGCVGNIAKINTRILRCWKAILDQMPSCRLLIRAINFEDSVAEDVVRERLTNAGLDSSRIDLRKPEGGAAFFGSYNEIDVILDTYPFNGGTTTCFATYMGVPVVSWAGASLISRMGLSILTNLAVPDLAVSDADAYIARAVAIAQDNAFLQKFKRDARSMFRQSSLGNGKLFAQEFEKASKELLSQKRAGTLVYQHNISVLPADEITRRAYAVLSRGQTDAAQRILNHCLNHYPDNGSAHLLAAQQLTSKKQFEEATEYLLARLDTFTPAEQIAAMMSVIRFYLLLGWKEHAVQTIEKLSQIKLTDTFDRLQVKLYRACCPESAYVVQPLTHLQDEVRQFHILIPCDDTVRFDAMCSQINASCGCPQGWQVNFERCNEERRIAAYASAMQRQGGDVLVIVQQNIELHNPIFFTELAKALADCDIVGFAGATRWHRMDWRSDEFACKVASFLVKSTERPEMIEIQCLGIEQETVTNHMAVLDGSLLALNVGRLQSVEFDVDLVGAELLLEEDWTHAAFLAGFRLAVHRNLGVLVDQQAVLDSKYRSAGRIRLTEKRSFDPFAILNDDYMMISAPVPNPSDAIHVTQTFLAICS